MPDLELKGFRGLRDLESLISVSRPDKIINQNLQYLSIDFLQSGKYQPRKKFTDESLTELADSIKAQGIIQPLIVRQVETHQYEIIAGERRWRAAKKAELKEVPVIIRNVEDNVALAFALIENIQREDLNPIEEAQAFSRLRDDFSMSHAAIAETVGRSRVAVTNILRLLSLEETVKSWLQAGQLEMGHARALLGLTNQSQIEAAKLVIGKSLSVRETEQLVQRINNPSEKQIIKLDSEFEKKATEWKKHLAKQLSSKVNMHFGPNGKGRVVIHFESIEEADWLMDNMKVADS